MRQYSWGVHELPHERQVLDRLTLHPLEASRWLPQGFPGGARREPPNDRSDLRIQPVAAS
jgi:hypothetical protein